MAARFPIMELNLHFVSQTKKYRTGCKNTATEQEEGAKIEGPGNQEAEDRPGNH
jgi:hypothetical protein